MKKIYVLLFIAFGLLVQTTNAQIGVTVTNPTSTTPNLSASYGSFAAALTDLNAITAMSGPVTLTLNAGETETAPSSGFTIGSATLNPVLSFGNSITIIKAAGAATTLNAGTGVALPTTAVPDGILKIVGADYVTIDGLSLMDANITPTTAMEFGIALFKASATDGTQNVTIQNCTISLYGGHNGSSASPMIEGSVGILAINSLPSTATTSVTPLGFAGTNSLNKIYANRISNCNYGIGLSGYAAPSPYSLGDTLNDIGGSSLATGNNISNFGGAVAAANPAAGIRINQQWGINIAYNTINNNDGGGTNHATTLRGIYTQASTNAHANISNNTITVSSGATTSALYGIENAMGGTGTNNVVNINNNTVTNCSYTSATTGVFTAILNSASVANLNLNENLVTSNSQFGTGDFHGIYTSTTNINLNINNNTVTGNSKSGASGTIYCIRMSTAIANITGNNIDGNSIPSTSGTSAANIYGIYSLSSPTGENFSNNTITNLSIGGVGTSAAHNIHGIRTNSVAASTKNIAGNIISGFSINATGGSGQVIGINTTTGNTVVIAKNRIGNLVSTGASSTAFGLQIVSGTTVTASNNLIGDLSTPTANAANPLIGINITGGTTINVYYNTVYLNGSSTGAAFGSSAISVSTTPTVTLRNNIFVNLSTSAGATGFTVSHRRSTTTLTSYSGASNNNLFYAGTASATNLIYYQGATVVDQDQTLAAYKARVAPRDGASISENPNFLSLAVGNAGYLHIDPTIATQIESAATTITGITDDVDADLRNVSTPDIGADEFAGIALDISGPSIVFTPVANTCTPGSRTLTATITDASGVPTAGAGLPVVYWSINAGPYNLSVGTHVGAGVYDFSVAAGSVQGDVITYYFMAQDNASTPNVSALPLAGASGFTINPPAAATPPTTPFSYSVVVPLNGTYTVGAGGNYTTLTAAVNDYNTKCLTGNVVFELTDATYPSETFPISIEARSDAGPSTRLTIRPAAGITPLISGSSTSAIIKLNGADFITIDGSNNATTTRDLTIQNTATTTNTAAIWVASLGINNGARFNDIKNSNIKAGSITVTSSFGIYVGGTSISTSGTGNDNDTLNILNNSISKAYYGIYAQATAAGVNNSLVINSNSIGSATAADYITFRGILVSQAVEANISQNTIFNMISANTNMRAMDFGAGLAFSVIANNNITEINYTATSNSGGKGITLASGIPTANVYLVNNMISALKGHGSSTASNNSWGISLNDGGGYFVYNNSINIPNNRTTTTSVDVQGGIYIASAVTLLDLRNNIISITGLPGNAGGRMVGIYSLAAAPFALSDYNDLYVNGAQHSVGYIGGTNRNSLADWQAATSQDANSISVAPAFVTATDLHLLPSNFALNNLGIPLAAVPLDFDLENRSLTTPDMGADEFSLPLGIDMGVASLVTPVTGQCYTTTESVSVTIRNYSANTIDFSLNPVTVTVTATGGYNSSIIINSGTLASGSTQNVVLPATIDMTVNGTYTFNSFTTVAGDVTASNDAMTATDRIAATLAGGTYTVGVGGNYTTLTAAVAAYNTASCITGPVIFSLVDATYPGETFPIIVNTLAARSSANLLTIKAGIAGINFSGSLTNGALIRILDNYVSIDGAVSGTSRDLSISNTSITGPSVILIGSTGTTPVTNVSVKNVIVTNGITSSTAIIVSDAGSPGASGYFNNISLENNAVRKAYMGMYINAIASAGNGSGLMVASNTLNSTGTDAIRYIGIYIQGVDGATVSKNEIANFNGTSGEDDKGMWLASGTRNSLVEKNRIYNLNYAGTSGYGTHGIYITTAIMGAGIRVSNNMIANLTGDGWDYTGTAVLDNPIGIVMTGTQSGITIHHNSINLYGNTLNQTNAMSMGLYLGAGSAADIRDNIIVNTLGLTTTIGYGAVGIYAVTDNTQFTAIDYNDYFINPTGSGNKFIGQIATTGQSTLAGWQTASGGEVNSLNVQPFFVSTTDLHIDPAVPANAGVDNLGTPIAGITTDIDDQARSLVTPDMGADEFTVGVIPVTIEYFKGLKQSDGNRLDWKVSCYNSPTCTMTLERSADGRNFAGLNTITATAVRCLQPFDYKDADPLPGINYYRLKSVDADGKVTYSTIIAILNKDNGFELISLAPNPVKDIAVLNISSAVNSTMEVLVTDISGRKISKQTVSLSAGSNQVNMNFAKLASGSYQVTGFTADGQVRTIRFVKQ